MPDGLGSPDSGRRPETDASPGARGTGASPAPSPGVEFVPPGAVAGKTLEACVIYATNGRPEILSRTFDAVLAQTVRPASVIVSCASAADAGTLAEHADVRVVTGPKGLSKQRNRALAAVPASADVVVFFDDDFVPHPCWIAEVLAVFQARPEVGAVTGDVLADDIKGPGLSVDEALAKIRTVSTEPISWVEMDYSPYGCNMAFRRKMIENLSFDERLVLYGWLEDRDFGARVQQGGGQAVKVGAARGVHMGAKRGRGSGVQLGYSQIVNPIYLCSKGTMRARLVARHIFGNVVSNLVKAVRPEPYIDRPGRLRGNLIGVLDVLRGRLTPERAERL